MAMKHRKLHPSFTATNDTTSCSEFCYPACSDDCFPVFSYLPPPPPPSSDGGQSHVQTAVVVSLVLIFFLVFIFVVRACKKQRARQPTPGGATVTEEEGILNEVRVDNPIWYISTAGLQQSVINSISVCKYKKNDGLVEGTDCSVCLSEFRENETLRLLPKCSHAFHISCIDTWLGSHTNCPLCRSIIVADSAVGSETAIRALIGRERSGDPGSNEETQMETSGSSSESGRSSEVADTEDATATTHDVDERISKGDGRNSKEEEDGEERERVRKTKGSMDSSSSESFEV